jgi:tRNA threonylcarbamoyladenosine biosynthesis protein TsaB
MSPQWLLGVETSGVRGSVCLWRGDVLLGSRVLSAERRHASELFPAIAELLSRHACRAAELDVLCWSQGPGSFTGLRISAALARMLMAVAGCRVVAVPTLEVIARNALRLNPRPDRLAVMLDARGGLAYAAAFNLRPDGALDTLTPAAAVAPAEFLAGIAPPFVALGAGVAPHREKVLAAGGRAAPDDYWQPLAEEVVGAARPLIVAGRFLERHQVLPLYVRPPECEQVYEQRRAAARQRALGRAGDA